LSQKAPEIAARFRCLADFEPAARERMPHAVYEFVAGAAGDELTMADNKAAFDRLRLRPRVLRDMSSIATGVTLLGDTLPHPILLAPTSFQRMSHPEGEVATARGAGKVGAVFVLSTAGTATIEECVAASAAPVWFLLYWQSDRGFNRELVARVAAGGARALCVTVDTPTLGDRHRQQRAGFEVPAGLATPHFHDRNTGLRRAGSGQHAVLTWRDVEWLRSLTGLPLVLKGILDPDDAAQAIDVGADGIVVSNHGARNIDTLPATADALPAVAARVDGRVPLIIDGGVRRGTDVLKCLALGASAVMIGRPYVYALAVAGAEGVSHCVGLLRRELETAMALTGRASVQEIDGSLIW
jgi:4-hydroxymandelate oxidase